MGGGGKGGNTTTSSFQPPAAFMKAYKESLEMARDAVNDPYKGYKGDLVAGLTPTQKDAIRNINAAQGMALPAIQKGMDYTQQAAKGITPELYKRFYSPYVKDVANTTFANLMESQAQQQSGLKSGAIQAGAFGGDRGGIAQAEMARQQQLGNAMAMSNIYNQGYGQAMGLAGQQVANLGAMGQQMAGLGAGAQGSVLQGAQAQMAAGAQQQATKQAELQAAYQQWMQRQAYPYQQAQFFANIAQGLGAGAGGTSSTTGPEPNLFSQILGGVGAIGSISGPSDKRVKENIEAVGTLNDGQTVYRYNFKGDPKTQIGLLAQEVEEQKPGAVTQVKGLKMVDYKGATDDAAKMSSMGGVVAPSMSRQGLAGGGIPYYPYGDAISYVPEGKIGSSGDTIPGPISASEENGLAAGWGDIAPISKEQASGLRRLAADVGIDLPKSKEAEEYDEENMSDNLFRTGIKAVKEKFFPSPSLYASGGLVGRGHYQDGGMEDVPTDEGLASVPAPEDDETYGLGAPIATVAPEREGLAAVDAPQPVTSGVVIKGEKPSPKFNLGKIFASEENPSLIERVMGRRLSPEARAAVMNASFALMAGRSPFFLTNLGEAGRVGTSTYYNAVREAEQSAEKRRKRAREEEIRQQMEEAISNLPPEQQQLARMVPEKFFGAQVENMFGTKDSPSLVQEYLTAKKEGFPGTLADWKTLGSASNTRSFAPIPYTKPDGTIGYGVPRDDGTFVDIQSPEGAEFLSPFEKARQTSSGTAEGKITTEQTLSAPSDIQAANQAIKILDQIISSPYLESGTGFSSLANVVPGTGGYDFQNLVNQAKSGAFLTAIEQLRGLGALSNAEGSAATLAITRMDTSTSREAFVKAVMDYRAIVEAGKERALARLNASGQGSVIPPAEEQNTGPVYDFNAETGELE